MTAMGTIVMVNSTTQQALIHTTPQMGIMVLLGLTNIQVHRMYHKLNTRAHSITHQGALDHMAANRGLKLHSLYQWPSSIHLQVMEQPTPANSIHKPVMEVCMLPRVQPLELGIQSNITDSHTNQAHSILLI